MFCDTRYLLHRIATKVLCFCVISSFLLFIFIWRRTRTARLPFQRQARAVSFGPTNYEECLHQSEWVSEWVTHLHIGVHTTNLVSTLRVNHSFKNLESICCPSYEMDVGSWQAWVLITWCNTWISSKIINYYKWRALISFMGERKRKKNMSEGKRKEKKFVRLQPPKLELSPFTLSQLSNTVYQRIEVT